MQELFVKIFVKPIDIVQRFDNLTSMLKKSPMMAARIRKMKKGDSFRVGTESERQSALRTAKTLREAGVFEFRVTTYPQQGAFVVACI